MNFRNEKPISGLFLFNKSKKTLAKKIREKKKFFL
ncbi:hypothetical protein A6A24_17760 [Bacillus subtilis]|nr:hypothetical protein A6A24_17760 [Bacillus subtilis]